MNEEMTEEQLAELKTTIKEELNKILILLKDVKGESTKDTLYLSSVKSYIGRVLKDEETASHNEDQYYNSNCF